MSNVSRLQVKKWRIYLQEAETQLAFADRCFSSYEEALAECNTEAVFLNLHHFIVHLANVDKLLWPKPGTARAVALAEHVDLSGVDFKPIRRLRNHLEHFDERLDAWIKDYDGYALLDMNIVTGAIGFPSKGYLRALDGNTFMFHGESYDLSPLRNIARELHARLKASGGGG